MHPGSERVDDADDIRALKRHLFDAYGGFADKRIKNLDKGQLFIIDDRRPDDHGADKKLYSWFCLMFAKVVDAGSLEVILRSGIPWSPAIEKWVEAGNATCSEVTTELLVPVRVGEEDRLRELASLTEQIVRRGARYPVPAYKYVCPRVASSLRQLADVLGELKD